MLFVSVSVYPCVSTNQRLLHSLSAYPILSVLYSFTFVLPMLVCGITNTCVFFYLNIFTDYGCAVEHLLSSLIRTRTRESFSCALHFFPFFFLLLTYKQRRIPKASCRSIALYAVATSHTQTNTH